MLYGLLDGDTGVFLRNDTGDIVGSYVFNESQSDIYDSNSDSSSYKKQSLVNGPPVTGYNGSDIGVRLLRLHTDEATKVSHT